MTEYNTAEAARKLNVSQAMIVKAVKDGRLPARQILWKTRPVWRIAEADLLAMKVFNQGRPPDTEEPNPSGICQCGCGQQLTRAVHSSTRRGVYKGDFPRFAPGHNDCALSPVRYLVDEETGCWVWQRFVSKRTGYGTISGKLAHKVLWEKLHGPVPDGKDLDHLCHNRRCVNPDHLEAVTHVVNCRRGDWPKIDKETAERIRHLRATEHLTYKQLAAMFSVSDSLIWAILKGRVWTL